MEIPATDECVVSKDSLYNRSEEITFDKFANSACNPEQAIKLFMIQYFKALLKVK